MVQEFSCIFKKCSHPALFGQAQSKPPAFVKVMYWGGVQNVRDHGKNFYGVSRLGKNFGGLFFEPFQGPLECSPTQTHRKFKEVNIHKKPEKMLNRPGRILGITRGITFGVSRSGCSLPGGCAERHLLRALVVVIGLATWCPCPWRALLLPSCCPCLCHPSL